MAYTIVLFVWLATDGKLYCNYLQSSITILNFLENTYGKICVLYLGKYVVHLIILGILFQFQT